MSVPFSGERFIVKAHNQPQPVWTGNCDDIDPFLVSLQDIGWKTPYLPPDPLVFIHRPHTFYNIGCL